MENRLEKNIDQAPLRSTKTHMLELDYSLVRAFDADDHAAITLDALSPLLAHLLQRPHPAFVSGAPRRDALGDPDLLLRKFPIEMGAYLLLGVQPFLAATEIVVVVTGPARQFAQLFSTMRVARARRKRRSWVRNPSSQSMAAMSS